MFYINPQKFMAALLNADKPEWAIREGAGLGMTSWVKAKRGNKPLRPLTVKRIANALGVTPASLIACDTEGFTLEEVKTA